MSDSFSECDWFWTANGKAIGYRESEGLFSSCGTQIGVFEVDEVYGVSGSYLGEVSNTGRLVTKYTETKLASTEIYSTHREPS
jgi:hypothetical protein